MDEIERGPLVLDTLAACRALAERVVELERRYPGSPSVLVAGRQLKNALLALGRLMVGA